MYLFDERMQLIQYALLVFEWYELGRLEKLDNERAGLFGGYCATAQHIRLELAELAEKDEAFTVDDLFAQLFGELQETEVARLEVLLQYSFDCNNIHILCCQVNQKRKETKLTSRPQPFQTRDP